MPTKNEILVALVGVAIIGFIVYYFFYKKTPQTQSTQATSPFTTITSDIGSFVGDVQNAFSKVLSAGGNAVSGLAKDVGWGEKQLANTVGIISTGASRFGKTVVSDTEHFVQGVENVFGDAGKMLSGGVSTIAKDVEGAGSQVEKTLANIPSDASLLLQHFKVVNPNAIYRILGVSQAPKEITNTAKTVGVDVEHGVGSFVNDVKSLFNRF